MARIFIRTDGSDLIDSSGLSRISVNPDKGTVAVSVGSPHEQPEGWPVARIRSLEDTLNAGMSGEVKTQEEKDAEERQLRYIADSLAETVAYAESDSGNHAWIIEYVPASQNGYWKLTDTVEIPGVRRTLEREPA